MTLLSLLVVLGQCELQTGSWNPPEPIGLMTDDGHHFATLESSICVNADPGPNARVTFNTDGAASVRLLQSGVRIRAQVARIAVQHHAALPFDDGFVASSSTVLQVTSTAGNTMSVVPAPRHDFEHRGEWTSRRLACEDVRLAAQERRGEGLGKRLLRRAPLSTTADAPHFDVAQTSIVKVLLHRPPLAKVAVLTTDGASLTGWMRYADIDDGDADVGHIGLSWICDRFARLRGAPTNCGRALKLFARNHDTRSEVGTLDRATDFDVMSSDDAWTDVELRDPPAFVLRPGWSYALRTEDLQDCSAFIPATSSH